MPPPFAAVCRCCPGTIVWDAVLALLGAGRHLIMSSRFRRPVLQAVSVGHHMDDRAGTPIPPSRGTTMSTLRRVTIASPDLVAAAGACWRWLRCGAARRLQRPCEARAAHRAHRSDPAEPGLPKRRGRAGPRRGAAGASQGGVRAHLVAPRREDRDGNGVQQRTHQPRPGAQQPRDGAHRPRAGQAEPCLHQHLRPHQWRGDRAPVRCGPDGRGQPLGAEAVRACERSPGGELHGGCHSGQPRR